jgi:hypothetical protein
VTPAKWGKGKTGIAAQQQQDQTTAESRASMTWARRLNRIFHIDIETCAECGGVVKVIACIEDPMLINKILLHLDQKAIAQERDRLPESRDPLQAGWFRETHQSKDRLS